MSDAAPPKTSRRRRFRTALSFVLAVVLSAAIAVVFVTKSSFVSNQVNDYVNRYLKDTPFEFHCESLTGNYFRSVSFGNVSLRYVADDNSFDVFRADGVTIDYRILDVLRLNLVADNLTLRNVYARLTTDENGQLVIPSPPPKPESSVSSGFTGRVDVRNFVVDGLNLNFGAEDAEMGVTDLSVEGSLTYGDGEARLVVDDGRAYLVETQTMVSSVRMEVLQSGDRVTIRDMVVRLNESFLMASGTVHPGGVEGLRLVFNPVSLEELHALGIGPDVEGTLAGNVTLDGPVDSLSVTGRLTGDAVGLAVRGLSVNGTVTAEQATMTTVRGNVFGATVDGAVRYEIATGDVWFEGDARRLDLSQGFIPDDGIPETDINGKVDLYIDWSEQRYAYNAKLDSVGIDGYWSKRVDIVGEWDPVSGLTIRQSRWQRPGYTVEANGTITADNQFNVLVRGGGRDLTYLWNYLGLNDIRGEVEASGLLAGHLDSLQLNLNGDVRNAGFLFADVDSGRVRAEIRNLLSPDSFVASVSLGGDTLRARGFAFSDPSIFFVATPDSVTVRDFSFAAGDTLISANFMVAVDGDTSDLWLRHLEIVTAAETWRSDGGAHLITTPVSWALRGLSVASPNGSLLASGAQDADGTLQLEGRARNLSLDLIARAMGAPGSLTGSIDADVSVAGTPDRPTLTARVESPGGRADRFNYDRIEANIRVEGGRYSVDDVFVVAAGDSITGEAELLGLPSLTDWGAFERDQLHGVGVSGVVRTRGFAVDSVLTELRSPWLPGGAFAGSFAVSGTLDAPELRLDGHLRPPAETARALPGVNVLATYANGSLQVERLVDEENVGLSVLGTFPMDISLLDGARVRPNDAVRASINMDNVPLARVTPFIPNLEKLKGTGTGNVTVTGTMEAPRFAGGIKVTGGTLSMLGMAETYRDITAEIAFSGNQARLETLKARSGDGNINGNGVATFSGFAPSSYRVDIYARNLWFRSIPDVESLQDGHIIVSSVRSPDGSRIIPNITGKVTVKEGIIRPNFDQPQGGQGGIGPSASPEWLCRLDLSAPKNVWARNADMNVELGGDVVLIRDTEGLYLRGVLDILRGTYTVYNRKFRVIEGTLDFSVVGELRPDLTVNAYTPHRNEGGIEYRIYLLMTWPRDRLEPEIILSYDEPGYYESDIWQMLGGSDVAGGLAANALERAINEQMSVPFRVEVDRVQTGGEGADSSQETVLGVGRYLWEDVYLRYRQGLTVQTEREVEVEYRLSNMFLIRSEIIRHSGRKYVGSNRSNRDEFNVDIKIRWEF